MSVKDVNDHGGGVLPKSPRSVSDRSDSATGTKTANLRVRDPDHRPDLKVVSHLMPSGDVGRDSVGWQRLRHVRCDGFAEWGVAELTPDRDKTTGAEVFDLLRTRFLRILKSNGWSRLAVLAPTPGCGTTFCAANLAQSLSRLQGSRTVLLDLNRHHPDLGDAFGLDETSDMASFLNGTLPFHRHLVRLSHTLAIGPSDRPALGKSQELLTQASGGVLDAMTRALQPDVVLFDLPAMLRHDDFEAVLPHVDGVLLVADGTRTRPQDIADCERKLAGKSPVLGVILNRAQDADLSQ